ncbi:MAG TPA: hypothetical protein VLA19_19740 [Herpetosiphonaceae bacterium]|nr:hypothetical protein [Herpetosiphonaceae bacterium]
MLPIEIANYNAWAERLEAALEVVYPSTVWLVADLDDSIELPVEENRRSRFCLIAMTQDGGRYVSADVPFPLVVDEETFPLVVVALGREIERRLAATVGDA